MFIDTHCHLFERSDKTEVLERAKQDKIFKMIDVAFDTASSFSCRDFYSKIKEVYFTAGVHPDAAKEVSDKTLNDIKMLSNDTKCVAIGEIGLDYHYEGFDKKVQIDAFIKQIELANEVKLPFQVHSRDCTKDIVDVLISQKAKINNGAIMHCYSGSVETAKILLDLGFYISFSGTLTFKNARALPDVCAYLPLDRVLSETDSPYLAPVPLRGTVNEPKNVKFVTEKIASIMGLDVDVVANTILTNAYTVMPKLKN